MEDKKREPYAVKYDLTNCDKEPVHLIRYVQSHVLLVCCQIKSEEIIFISDNCQAIIGKTPEEYLGNSISLIFSEDTLKQIRSNYDTGDNSHASNTIYLPGFANDTNYTLVSHINAEGLLVIELEPSKTQMRSPEFQINVGNAVSRIQQEGDLEKLFDISVREIKKLSGFDRVMAYKFDEEGNGTVIAEAAEAHLSPYLGLKYPATDIPKQARELFKKNQLRFIADLTAPPALIFPLVNPHTQKPLDQTLCMGRGTSPIHVEYLLNMGVRASMTLAVLKNGELWGLFACHHYQAIRLDYSVRMLIKFMSQIISGHLAISSATTFRTKLLQAQVIKSKLLEQMLAGWDAVTGLTGEKYAFTDLFDCSGGAIYTENEISLHGDTPSKEEIKSLVKAADFKDDLIIKSFNIKKDFPGVFKEGTQTAGVLLLQINDFPNKQLLLWFRKEKRHLVNWAGNPEKAVSGVAEGVRLSPRKSFEKWQVSVKDEAETWSQDTVNIAFDLRSDIKEFFLKKYRELQIRNADLTEAYENLDSFSYTVAHDLRAPLRSIKGFAQILEEDYADKLDNYGQKVLGIILESTDKMNSYINNILNIAKLGRQSLSPGKTDIKKLLNSVFEEEMMPEKVSNPDRKVNFILAENIPSMQVDYMMFKQALNNIIGNAIKYSRNQETAVIEVAYRASKGEHVLSITDNGIGFEEKYKEKVFEIFSRLTNDENIEGTGVGMTIAQKILHKHKGRIDCRSTPGQGSTFELFIPV